MRKKRSDKCDAIKYTLLPHLMTVAPLFPPLPQKTEYTLEWQGIKWTTGCQNPAKYRRHDTPYCRGFDIRHFDLIAVLIEQYRKGELDNQNRLFIGYRGLLSLLNRSAGGAQAVEYISLLVDDLLNTNMLLELPEEKTQLFRVLSSVIIDRKNNNNVLTHVRFSEEFIEFIRTIEKVVNFRLDTKISMTSPIAQALFTFLPSRAIHHTEEKPFEITLTKLLHDLRLPTYRYKSKRRDLFMQNKNPIIQQLDGAPMTGGRRLRAKLAETVDKTDYKLCTWVDSLDPAYDSADPDGVLYRWWVEAGRTEDEFKERVKLRLGLFPTEIERLSAMNIDVAKYKPMLTIAKALSPNFSGVLADCYSYHLTKKITDPGRYFLVAIKNSFTIPGTQQQLNLDIE